MSTSTSLQVLAALAIGSALLASATPADARGAVHASFRSAPVASRAPASFGHGLTAIRPIKFHPNPQGSHPAKHCIVKCSSTTTTASHPVTPPCDFNCVKTTITPNGQIAVVHPVRPPLGGRPTMSPGPGAVAPVSQPAPVAPVATQPSAPAPVQPSCLRQAVTQDGQVVTFDVCHNQAVVAPLAQVQTQPQTQTQ